MKTLPSGIVADIAAGTFSIRHMLRVELDEGASGIWNGDFDVEVDGLTYAGIPGNMSVPEVQSGKDLSAEAVTVMLGAFDQDVINLLNATTWHQRPATLFKAWLGADGNVAHVEPWFSGFLDSAPVQGQADQPVTIAITIESNNRELSRSSGRKRSDNDQRRHGGATDGFYKYGPTVAVQHDIYWGRKGPSYPVR